MGQKGYYIQPTIFTDVKEGMQIFDEEIFGPVQSIAKFSTLDEVSIIISFPQVFSHKVGCMR